jgi:ribosomal protein L21E
MVKPSKGSMSGRTRFMRARARVSVSDSVKSFKIGCKIVLVPRPKCRGEVLRFAGKHGKIVEIRGKSYMIEIKDGGKMKKMTIAPIHLELAV